MQHDQHVKMYKRYVVQNDEHVHEYELHLFVLAMDDLQMLMDDSE